MKLEVALENGKINTCKGNDKRKLAYLGKLGMFCCKVSSYQQDFRTQLSFNRGMDTANVVHLHTGVLLSC